ncbi:anti-sigma F factor antagonist [Pseudanabaena sp. SR411]|uniref:STAS domain-containing protein n=1 Tax=Pseudanabaena sp. SR411 TaxID=1980935 RepID=UPI000B9834AE|nr:STAS domain-containing protein [Pseudanabaena sp. SR411]OYQ64868.1 anti-sigma F factor antagonist [Pseudanabaena sp. SR411]
MALQVLVKNTNSNTLSLALDGQLDSLTAPNLDKSIQTSLTQNIKTLIFDLQSLSFISSAGLRVFAKTRKTLKSREGDVFFINITPQVKKVFDIVKAVPISEVFANVEELDKYLAVMQSNVDEENI